MTNTTKLLDFANLHDPNRYRYEIQKLFNKLKDNAAVFKATQEDVPYFSFGFDQKRLSEILAKEIRLEQYVLSAPTQHLIKTRTKPRLVYDYKLTDKIVIAVVSRLLTELNLPYLSPRVFSYRRNVPTVMAVKELSAYLAKAKKKFGTAGIFVYKTDISAYTDEIPVHEKSLLWTQLQALFEKAQTRPSEYQWNLIKQIIRPAFYDNTSCLMTHLYGIPTGSAITNFLYNFYASSVDEFFHDVPELFYSRYGDDILLAHPELNVLHAQEEKVDKKFNTLGLRRNLEKEHRLYLSPAGNKSQDDWKGTNYFEYLGFKINGQGTFTLSTKRQRLFLRSILKRIENTYQLISRRENDKYVQASLICKAINSALVDPVFAEYRMMSLMKECSDHSQLKHLDYHIALRIAERVTGIQGVKAFRVVNYEFLRKTCELHSLIQLRNKSVL